MTGYKKFSVIFFCLLVFRLSAKDNKDTILNNFFERIRMSQTESFPALESIKANIKLNIELSPETFSLIKSFIQTLGEEIIANNLSGTGNIKIKFMSVDGINKPQYIYLYCNSSLIDFVFTKAEDNIEIMLPRIGVVIKDNISEVERILKQYGQQKVDINKQPFPSNISKEVINYIIANESKIREAVKMEKKTGKKDNITTYVFSYPVPDGEAKIEIFDKYWTFATVSFQGRDNSFIKMNYSIPEGKSGYLVYLPETILLEKSEKGNKLSIEFSDITYNHLFSENEFKVLNMNFQEFTAFMYLKLLQGGGK